MGFCIIWHFHVLRVQREASRLGRASELCQASGCKQAIFRSHLMQSQSSSLICRSVSMDAWSPEQLKRMQLGGNDALNAFLKNYGVDKHTDIRDKYNSQAAEVCRACYSSLLHCSSMYKQSASTISKSAAMRSSLYWFHCSITEIKSELR